MEGLARILRQDSLPFCFSGSYHWLAGVVKQIVVILPNELHQAQPEWEWQTQTNRPCTRLFTTNIHLSFCCSSRPQSFNLTLVVLRHRRPLLQYSWSGWLAGKSCWRKNENISQGGLFSVVWRGLEPVELSIGSWYAMTMFWQYGVGGWGERERCCWVTRCLLDGAPLGCSPQWLPPGLLVYLPYAAYVLGCREFQELFILGLDGNADEMRPDNVHIGWVRLWLIFMDKSCLFTIVLFKLPPIRCIALPMRFTLAGESVWVGADQNMCVCVRPCNLIHCS